MTPQPEEFDPSVQDQYFSAMACVSQCCIDLDIPESHYGNKILSWILRGLVEIKLDCSNELRRIILPVSDVSTCVLPGDFIDWVAVGAIRGQYFVKFATEDSLVGLPRTTENWNPSQMLPPGFKPNGTNMNDYAPWLMFNGGGIALPSFSGQLPQTGQFKIANGQIMLDAMNIDQIYLEYIGLGISICGETILHPYYFEYSRAYANHQWEKFKRGPEKSEAAIMRTGRELWHQEQKVRGRVFAITPTDLLKTSRRSYRLTAKA